jgi:hypothetical protein
MNASLALNICAFVAALQIASAAKPQPLALHPDNPHYFLWRGKPAVLITSAEHYGAVLNLDFDYATYLKALERDKLNLTRTWAGAYVEPMGAFRIASNSLAPANGRFICPWARSDQPGYANGGNKFDLTKWDENYFTRLKDFMKQAGKRGVIVEMNLFCPMYEEPQWKLSPQNAINNVNGIGTVARTNIYTLDKHGGLLAIQEAMTRKIVTELNGFDNLYYEICNEPYFRRRDHRVAAPHRRRDCRNGERRCRRSISFRRTSPMARRKSQTRTRPISVFNFHLRVAAECRGGELRAEQSHSATTRLASKGRTTRIIGWKRGNSFSRAADSTTTWITPLWRDTSAAISFTRKPSPAAAIRSFANRCESCATSSATSTLCG